MSIVNLSIFSRLAFYLGGGILGGGGIANYILPYIYKREREREREKEDEHISKELRSYFMISIIIYYNSLNTRERGKTNVFYMIYDCIL